MLWALSGLAVRFRVLVSRLLVGLGFREETFLLFLAIVIGVVTSAAAIGFHELIDFIRDFFYVRSGPEQLYGNRLVLIILIPTVGGLIVGITARLFSSKAQAHGVIDVMESVMRSGGHIRPAVAIEKIFTSAVTIGTGGSAGAEGPIVQIGAAIASGIGQFFRIARQHMPILIGCGTAAGISAIFNAPIGGVLFTLEIILLDFSVRTFTPVVLASVIANVTTRQIFAWFHEGETFGAIFSLHSYQMSRPGELNWASFPSFLVLGVICGVLGVVLTRSMYAMEERFSKLKIRSIYKPAIGAALMGVLGVAYILIFGWAGLGEPKPIRFDEYPMPAFFGDGYGVVQQLFSEIFFAGYSTQYMVTLLVFLLLAKVVATCLTLASGGSGGIIAPSLFLGAVAGALLGLTLKSLGWTAGVQMHVYALVGMGAVLAAVVHAPLASILILSEVTGDRQIVLPAMLATVLATGSARLLFRDSIYTLSLRRRGLQIGNASDAVLLGRLTVEQVDLEPATVVHLEDPLQRVVELSTAESGVHDCVVVDKRGSYAGMILSDDLATAILQRDAIHLLLVAEIVRTDLPMVKTSDTLATVLDTFTRYDVSRLPVCIVPSSGKVIGLISRAALMARYRKALAEA